MDKKKKVEREHKEGKKKTFMTARKLEIFLLVVVTTAANDLNIISE